MAGGRPRPRGRFNDRRGGAARGGGRRSPAEGGNGLTALKIAERHDRAEVVKLLK